MGEFDMGGSPPGPPPPLPWLTRESESSAYTEKKFGDQVLVVWESGDLPPDAAVVHVTLLAYRGERVVVTWRNGKHFLIEGDVREGETAEEAIKRIASEQAGIVDPVATHLGHFVCRATVHSKTQAPGSVTHRALYGVDVGSLADFPSDPAFERRIVSTRDLGSIIRNGYLENRREYTDALDKFLLARLKASQAQ